MCVSLTLLAEHPRCTPLGVGFGIYKPSRCQRGRFSPEAFPPRGRLTVAWRFCQGPRFAGRRPLPIAASWKWGPRGPRHEMSGAAPRTATLCGRVPRGRVLRGRVPCGRVLRGRVPRGPRRGWFGDCAARASRTLPPFTVPQGPCQKCGFCGCRVRAQVLHAQRAPRRPGGRHT